MKMHIRTWIGLTALAAALSLSAAAVLIPADRTEQPEPEGYMLRAYCGHVAVYRPNGTQPVETTDIELKSLPSADRVELENGIFISDQAGLARMLEDLGS